MTRAFYEKVQMGCIFYKTAPHAVPKQVVIDYDNLTASKAALSEFRSDYIILKPIDGTRAQGVLVIHKTKLKKILDWLVDEDVSKKYRVPKFEDAELTEHLLQLDKKADQSGIRMCLAQEYIHPATIKVNNAVFRPTVRIVIVACYDKETNHLELRISEFYYKLPTTPISRTDTLLWEETISYHNTNREIEFNKKTPIEKLDYLQRFANRKVQETKYPYTVLIPEELRNIVDKDVLLAARPTFQFLFETSTFKFYSDVLEHSPLEAGPLLKKFMRLSIHQILGEDLCRTFEKHKLNVVVILLYHLRHRIIIYKEIDKIAIIPSDFPQLLFNYQFSLGSKEKHEIAEIENLAEDILNNFHLLEKCYSKKDLVIVRGILDNYHQKKFGLDFQSGDIIYQVAMIKFKENLYSEATQLLNQAIKKFPLESKEQAICYYSLASCYIKQDLYKQAVESAEKCYALREKLLLDKKISETDVQRAQTKITEARELEKAEKIAQVGLKAFKECHYKEAKDNFVQAVEIHNKLQTNSTKLASYLYNLGSSYAHLNHTTEAIKYYKLCLEIKKNVFGADNEQTKKVQSKINELEDNTNNNNNNNNVNTLQVT